MPVPLRRRTFASGRWVYQGAPPPFFFEGCTASVAEESPTRHLRTCSGSKSLVCFYQESGPNLSRAGGVYEKEGITAPMNQATASQFTRYSPSKEDSRRIAQICNLFAFNLWVLSCLCGESLWATRACAWRQNDNCQDLIPSVCSLWSLCLDLSLGTPSASGAKKGAPEGAPYLHGSCDPHFTPVRGLGHSDRR